jgi:hypothetical protein
MSGEYYSFRTDMGSLAISLMHLLFANDAAASSK